MCFKTSGGSMATRSLLGAMALGAIPAWTLARESKQGVPVASADTLSTPLLLFDQVETTMGVNHDMTARSIF
jgi:hypothetical protein